MPIFDFICRACDYEFEFLVIGDRPYCPKCGSDDLQKKMSAFSCRTGGKGSAGSSSAGCSGCAGGSCATCK
ncbi:MAG: FmdB family zinc ribbon protein [Thermodesulfobacteriota bacterium]